MDVTEYGLRFKEAVRKNIGRDHGLPVFQKRESSGLGLHPGSRARNRQRGARRIALPTTPLHESALRGGFSYRSVESPVRACDDRLRGHQSSGTTLDGSKRRISVPTGTGAAISCVFGNPKAYCAPVPPATLCIAYYAAAGGLLGWCT
jgi:hypothetical protein